MSTGNSTSAIGGVRNLRAIFENKPSEDRSASPPSRGRSPANSETPLHSRPVSKVRANFILVERPDELDEGQHWGLRKASDVAEMADCNQETDPTPNVNGAPTLSDPSSQLNGTLSDSEPRIQPDAVDESINGGLGTILKGSAFEGSSPVSESKRTGTSASESPKTPTRQKNSPGAPRTNNKSVSGTPSKSVGRKIIAGVSSNQGQPPSTKLNFNKDAKSVISPPTKQSPAVKPTATSPTSPIAPKSPVSRKAEKVATKGSAGKPMAVIESAKKSESPEQVKTSPKLPRVTKPTPQNGRSQNPASQGPSSPKANGLKKEAKSTSPETKPKFGRVSTSAAAPTASSAARSGTTTTLGRKPTVTKRDPPPIKNATSTASATRKAPRTSIPPLDNGTDKTKPRTSTGRKAPNESFLARMMRPTASSAQKTHEKLAPSSPPQPKRAALQHVAKGKDRRSPTMSGEDKENDHAKEQEMAPESSAAEPRDIETDGVDRTESLPLNDITPPVESSAGDQADSNLDAVDVAGA